MRIGINIGHPGKAAADVRQVFPAKIDRILFPLACKDDRADGGRIGIRIHAAGADAANADAAAQNAKEVAAAQPAPAKPPTAKPPVGGAK